MPDRYRNRQPTKYIPCVRECLAWLGIRVTVNEGHAHKQKVRGSIFRVACQHSVGLLDGLKMLFARRRRHKLTSRQILTQDETAAMQSHILNLRNMLAQCKIFLDWQWLTWCRGQSRAKW